MAKKTAKKKDDGMNDETQFVMFSLVGCITLITGILAAGIFMIMIGG